MAQFSRSAPTTVLIVEHEGIVRRELGDQLTDLGFTVLVAGNADEGIALLETHPEIELLLTDIKMPGSMDGIRLAHHVRDRWPPVKIIVVSGMIETQLADLPRGSAFLPKPYDPCGLAEVIGHLTDRKRPPLASARSGSQA
jgi:CheY-like chemotaxis protein